MALTEAQIEYYEGQTLRSATAALAWLVYDIVINWDKEIERIWRRPRSWVKWIYFFARYIPAFHEGAVLTLTKKRTYSVDSCKGWIYWEFIFIEVITLTVEIILVMRLYILYSRNKIILGMILCALVAEVAVMAAIIGITLPRLKFRSDCLISTSPGIFLAFWLASLIFETFLFALTLVKFYQSVSRSLGKHSVLYIFIRDGTWAFALIFLAMLVNLLLYKLANSPLVGVGYYWALSVMSFAGSHILLNLRSLGLPNKEYDGAETAAGYEFTTARNTGSEWRTYFTTALDIEESPRETVELKTVQQVLDEDSTS